jgi:hypothetical protein
VARYDRTRDEVRSVYLYWQNRTHQVTLSGTRPPGGVWEIILYLYEPSR